MRVRSRQPWAWVVVLAALVSGCAVDGLAFVRDDRLDILSPSSGDTVRLPFEVRWSARDVDAKYLVLFDRTPMRPNRSLRSLVPSEDQCRTRPGCPDEQWLTDHNLYLTSGTSIRVEDLPEERTTNRAKDRHEVTIVLLDARGRRIGESVFIREFIVDRED
jgi:hypothetical protein